MTNAHNLNKREKKKQDGKSTTEKEGNEIKFIAVCFAGYLHSYLMLQLMKMCIKKLKSEWEGTRKNRHNKNNHKENEPKKKNMENIKWKIPVSCI